MGQSVKLVTYFTALMSVMRNGRIDALRPGPWSETQAGSFVPSLTAPALHPAASDTGALRQLLKAKKDPPLPTGSSAWCRKIGKTIGLTLRFQWMRPTA